MVKTESSPEETWSIMAGRADTQEGPILSEEKRREMGAGNLWGQDLEEGSIWKVN